MKMYLQVVEKDSQLFYFSTKGMFWWTLFVCEMLMLVRIAENLDDELPGEVPDY